MSAFDNTGLSVQVFEPYLGNKSGVSLGQYTNVIDSWTHTINAVGGYESASFAIHSEQPLLDEWFENGIGREIRLYNSALSEVWEGFVNKITYQCGGVQATKGPLTDTGNYVYLVYSTVDASTTPPTVGIRRRVGPYENSDSQDTYGIIVKVLSSGGVEETIAPQIPQAWILEHALPQISLSESGAMGAPSIQIDCAGYYKFLDLYIYNTTSTTQNYPSVKIQDILDADPNSLFANESIVENDEWTESDWERDDATAWSIIQRLVAMGGASFARYLFGVYNGRQPIYAAAPTAIEYYRRLSETGEWMTSYGTNEGANPVMPWDVRPGKWVFYPDFLPGMLMPAGTTLRDDPRATFIEQVTYTAPWTVTWSGSRNSSIKQRLARLGLAGIGG